MVVKFDANDFEHFDRKKRLDLLGTLGRCRTWRYEYSLKTDELYSERVKTTESQERTSKAELQPYCKST